MSIQQTNNNQEESSGTKVPNLELRNRRYLLNAKVSDQIKEEAKVYLFDQIKQNDMAPFYKLLCEEQNFNFEEALYQTMTEKNLKDIEEINNSIEKAKEEEGETEIFNLMIDRANYYSKVGDKEESLKNYALALEKAITLGQKLDIIFAILRVGFFFYDQELISTNIEKAKLLLEQGGDWDRRNRLKVYEGIFLMSIRDFKGSSELLLDSVATFTSTELLSYKEFVMYAVLSASISLQRVDMKSKVIDSPEILEVLHEISHLETFITSLYQGDYKSFFEALAAIESEHLLTSSYLHVHAKYYVKELRIIAYTQLLESYRSVTLASVANSFGVSQDFIDRDMSKFIAANRLHCVIDKVNGVVETNRPDLKLAMYQNTIKQGDLLLNRVQKLSRVINI